GKATQTHQGEATKLDRHLTADHHQPGSILSGNPGSVLRGNQQPPHGTRDPARFGRDSDEVPTLRVVGQYEGGVIVSGMKMLATGAAFAHELWIGNILPLPPDQKAASITCALPVHAPELSLWSRKAYATQR
ncbi:4-hydroxyphenylacetate 3-hydroxylase N-terminal domain-containing protein, partial [Ancylobacter sp. G4_0304]|uniref:4-hydroxyphenylacetate 3-hydroxylase N-terminal domain-containing protein n=1 Tax=Ancylobacter sp. G4_0304 TaxID=3114289 RepID=UPI0039C62FE0